MKAVTDYPPTMPDPVALSSLFGGAHNAIFATGGSIPLACFFISNQDIAQGLWGKVMYAPPFAGSPLLSALRELERVERDDAIEQAWNNQTGKERPGYPQRTVAEVMRRTGCGFSTCARVLRARRLRP